MPSVSGAAPRALAAASLLGLVACQTKPASSASSAEGNSPERVSEKRAPSRFDARLSEYSYPFEVKTYAFEAQRQPLEMAYMDVAPDGEPEGTVMLLHGKNFSGAYWKETAEALSKAGLRVVIPDQLGFGKSSKPVNFQFTFEALALHTAGLLDTIGVEKVMVVGHSMGGMLATRFALMYPERTEKLALVNPIGLEDWAKKVPYVPVEHWYQNELKKTPEKVKAYMEKAYFDGKWKPEYDGIAEIQQGWTESPDRDQLAWVSALTYDMIFTQPVVYEMPLLDLPTLLVIGTRDRTALGKGMASAEDQKTMGLYEKLGPSTKAAIPGAKLVTIEGVGHIPQVEAWDVYIGALRDFLNGD